MKWSRILLVLGLLLSCHSHPHGSRDADEESLEVELDEPPTLSLTHWTDATELFIELPALIRGRSSPSAAHVTVLADFSALAEGQVTVVLKGEDGEERFVSDTPSVPGIFRPVAQPQATGTRRLIVEIRSRGISADHDLGNVQVFADVAEARAAMPEAPETAGRIAFLKEQQWPIEFATEIVAERAIRPTLRATGTIVARTDGDVLIAAPMAGRVTSGTSAFPRLENRVVVDDLMAMLTPRLEAADLASLELAVTSADLEVRFAERERERLERLRAEGAVPERRVEDALHAAEEARAALATAERRLGQFRRVQGTMRRGEGTVQLRAPLSGTVTEVHVAPGSFVEPGSPLFRVTDLTQVVLEVHVPAVDVGALATPRGASLLVEGTGDLIELPAEAMLARGSRIDPTTRTLPLLLAIENSSARLPLGAFARVLLVNGDERIATAVPESALVEDSGMFVVFVQVEGEAFERRIVRLGNRDRGYVEMLSGVRAGEHVVSHGAWSVKLAASSGAIPAHGHAH